MTNILAQLMVETRPRRSNLSNAIREGEWDDALSYLNEIKEVNEFEGTALHTASLTRTTPYHVLSMLIDEYPDAAKIQNKNGNTPLHHFVKSFSDKCVILLLDVAPETAGVQNTASCTPLHYTVEHFRSHILVGLMLQACPSALNVTNHLGQTPLDCFFRHWYEPIQSLLTTIDGDYNLPSEQILDIELVKTRTNRITVRHVYHTMHVLLRQKAILEGIESNPFDMPPILHSALYLNYCPWLFCKLLVHIHPKDLFEAKESIFLLTSKDKASQRSSTYNNIFKCTGCAASKSKLHKLRRGFLCHNCGEYETRILWNIPTFHRDEELERLQFIYFLLRYDPSLSKISHVEK